MLPQHPTQRRQHVGERGPRLGVPRRALRRKPRLRGRAPGVPRLHERHQDHRQRGLTIHGLAAPAAGVLEAQLLFGFQDRLFHAPAVAGPLGDLGVGRGRVRTEEKVVLLAAGRVADDHQADGHVPAHVIPRARDAQHQALDRAALLQESDAFPPFLAAGGHLAGRGQSPALLGISPPSARRAAGRRQGIQRRVGANPTHEIRAGRQTVHHVPRRVLTIGGDADFDARQVSATWQTIRGAKTREGLMSVLHTLAKRTDQVTQRFKACLDHLALHPNANPFSLLFDKIARPHRK